MDIIVVIYCLKLVTGGVKCLSNKTVALVLESRIRRHPRVGQLILSVISNQTSFYTLTTGFMRTYMFFVIL